MVSMIIIPTLVMMIFPAITMSFLITRDILAVIPVIMHKEDPLAAGIVFSAMLAPMLGVAGGYAQIDRRSVHPHPLNDYRLRVDHLWLRKIANIKLTIKSRLAYAERDTNIGSKYRSCKGGSNYRHYDQKTFHIESPIIMDLFRIKNFNYTTLNYN
jgi:hypothetical protein